MTETGGFFRAAVRQDNPLDPAAMYASAQELEQEQL